MKYEGPERRSDPRLTDDEITAIAAKVKELVLAEIYADIGKGMVSRVLRWLVVFGAGLAMYLTAKGYISAEELIK